MTFIELAISFIFLVGLLSVLGAIGGMFGGGLITLIAVLIVLNWLKII